MILDIQNISASYGARLVLRDLSLRANGGEVLGVVGANGAGKSTLLRVIGGTVVAKAGRVFLTLHPPGPLSPLPTSILSLSKGIGRERGGLGEWGEVELTKLSARQRAQRIAVVPQGARLPDAFTVMEVVLMGRTPYLSLLGAESAEDKRIAQWAMAQTDTLAFAERRIGELSGGEQQRVLVARALTQQPQVLLLDEATAHLDLKHQAEILGLARRMARDCGLIVIAALHDLNLAALYADWLALLRDGELLALDTPANVLTPSLLQRAYDVAVVVSEHPIHHTPLVALAS